MVEVVPVNIRNLEGPGFFMIKCVGKIRILLLKVQQCPDFSILQTIYPYVAPMEELARNLKIWIFPNFRHYPRIFASQELHAMDFLFHREGTDINWNHPRHAQVLQEFTYMQSGTF